MSQLLEAALEYAHDGLPVLPCWWTENGRCACGAAPGSCKPGKHPLGTLVPHGVKNATLSIAAIRSWWRRKPKANVAIATGGAFSLIVVDVDPDAGGEASLAKLEAEHGALPPTVECITPRGGRHAYLRVPIGRKLPGNSAGSKLGEGLDTRCAGGYVVAPPSTVHGHAYEWSVDSGSDFALAPEWLLDLLGPAPGEARPAEEWLKLLKQGVSEGARNNSVASLAGHLFRYLPDPDVAAQLVACFNEVCCRPPLPEKELVRTLDSIAALEQKRRRGS
jgi:hypothetical protein